MRFDRRPFPLSEVHRLPRWRQPAMLLVLMAVAQPIAFATWNALLNNFVIEAAHFDGVQIGWLQSVREVPGLLAIGVIPILWVIGEQLLALISLVVLGGAVAVTAIYPSFTGLLMTTLISSFGFHYLGAVNQSLQLQWIDKKEAPRVLGRLVTIGSAASLAAYALLVLTWKRFDLSFDFVYLVSGGATVVIALFCLLAYPRFGSPVLQSKGFVLRRRYWLFYLLQFMSGARRQIFVVFAAFMMVQKFGFRVDEVTALFLINYLANMAFAPVMGRALSRFGERAILTFEYIGLIGIFLAYAGVYFYDWGVTVAATLYILDQLFFALAFAMKTYFQKIADPRDIGPTSAVSFTINHIAAVGLPAALGYLWLQSPAAVFALAAGIAFCSLCLARLIPRHPDAGNETVLTRLAPPTLRAEA
ncbi:MFS transporter [Thioclava sp. BHET1]|nr:MFS transporter [Thioclava sp. BHET1]